jgi:acetoin utilization deacetylase AcuC-like enzyme
MNADAISDAVLDAALVAVHDPGFVRSLAQNAASLEDGQVMLDELHSPPGLSAQTPVFRGAFMLAREAVRTALGAAQLIVGGESLSYALCRPPGHHAGPAWFGGLCYFNNAVAAAHFLTQSGVAPLAIIDVDFHFGDGTSALLQDRRDIFYASVHSSTVSQYPWDRKERQVDGQRIVALGEAVTGDTVVAQVADCVREALCRGARALVVSMGYDGLMGDPYGAWRLAPRAFRSLGRVLADSGLPLCLVQEGGYNLTNLEHGSRALAIGLLKGAGG